MRPGGDRLLFGEDFFFESIYLSAQTSELFALAFGRRLDAHLGKLRNERLFRLILKFANLLSKKLCLLLQGRNLSFCAHDYVVEPG